jgi:hypothetical protein
MRCGIGQRKIIGRACSSASDTGLLTLTLRLPAVMQLSLCLMRSKVMDPNVAFAFARCVSNALTTDTGAQDLPRLFIYLIISSNLGLSLILPAARSQ